MPAAECRPARSGVVACPQRSGRLPAAEWSPARSGVVAVRCVHPPLRIIPRRGYLSHRSAVSIHSLQFNPLIEISLGHRMEICIQLIVSNDGFHQRKDTLTARIVQ